MKKWIVRIVAGLLVLVLVAGVALGVFIYKVKYGFATYETEAPVVELPRTGTNVLLYSKTTGFRHSEAIEAMKSVFNKLAKRNNWFLYETDEAGIINQDQIGGFDVIVWSNSTGRTLTDEQRKVVEEYVENGGSFMGIHGAGDDSHRWPWYTDKVLGATFSHHPIENQLQKTTIYLSTGVDTTLALGLVNQFAHTDEFYIFDGQPSENGFQYVYELDGESIDPNGNIFLIQDKDFGMGKIHPVAWRKSVGQGWTFYTSLGHNAAAINNPEVVNMFEVVVNWLAGDRDDDGQ